MTSRYWDSWRRGGEDDREGGGEKGKRKRGISGNKERVGYYRDSKIVEPTKKQNSTPTFSCRSFEETGGVLGVFGEGEVTFFFPLSPLLAAFLVLRPGPSSCSGRTCWKVARSSRQKSACINSCP